MGPQKLAAYMDSHGLSPAEIAERLDPPVASITVFRWISGTRKPRSKGHRKQLARITDGEVSEELWLTEAEQKKQVAKGEWLKKHPLPPKILAQAKPPQAKPAQP